MGCCSAKPLAARRGSARDQGAEDFGSGYGAPIKKPGFGGGAGKLHRPQQQHDIPEFREETISNDRKRRKEDESAKRARRSSGGSRQDLSHEARASEAAGEEPDGSASDGPERGGMPLVLRLSGGRKAPSSSSTFAVGLCLFFLHIFFSPCFLFCGLSFRLFDLFVNFVFEIWT